jgi:hypothetical protein
VGGLNSLAANDEIYTVSADLAGNVYAGGIFTDADSNEYVAKYNGAVWSEPGAALGMGVNQEIDAICTDASGSVYAGGIFYDVDGWEYVARYTNSSWSELAGSNDLRANLAIKSICTDRSGIIYAAGTFTDSTGRSFVARYGFPAGIDELSAAGALKLSPNPANNLVTISSGQNFSDATVRLVDLTGQVLIEKANQSGSKFTLDISNRAAGLYFIEVLQGGNAWTGKLVKE